MTSSSDVALAVVIVAWRSAELVVAALRSIATSELEGAGAKCRVYVVDNDSGDGTADRIAHALQENGWSWATLIRAERNGGFAYGNNVAIRAALIEHPALRFVLLLNPDTLVRPGAFQTLVDFLESNPAVGIAGGRSEDPDTTPQHCCFSFPSLASEFGRYLVLGVVERWLERWAVRYGVPEQPTRVGWVSGAHMMIRREVIEQIGLMDEGYFLYFEETDYTLRAARAGWECWHVPQSRIVHLVGQSSGVTLRDGRPRRRPKYWFESRRRYFVLNHGRLYAAVTDFVVLCAYGSWRLRRLVERKPDNDPPFFASDLLRYGAILNGRDSLSPRQTGR